MRKTATVMVLALMLVSATFAFAQDGDGTQFLDGEFNPDGLITLPLYQAAMADGSSVWFIVTEVSDEALAEAWGVNYAPLLAEATNMRTAEGDPTDASSWVFEAGMVDFAPEHSVTPGEAPNFFPPAAFTPGSVGDEAYTPLVNLGGVVFNAPIVAGDVAADALAFCDGGVDYTIAHDSLVSVCPDAGTATIAMTPGYSAGAEVFYTSMDANVDLVAALERATFAPGIGGADSATSPIYIAINGETGADNPHRQGMQTALSGEGPPLNTLGSLPNFGEYSPMWSVNLAVWTDAAVEEGVRARIVSGTQILEFAEAGWITNPEGGEFGASGPVVNCTVIYLFD